MGIARELPTKAAGRQKWRAYQLERLVIAARQANPTSRGDKLFRHVGSSTRACRLCEFTTSWCGRYFRTKTSSEEETSHEDFHLGEWMNSRLSAAEYVRKHLEIRK